MRWLALLVCLAALPAAAQYPDKPIRLVVGLAPGGATDIMARTLTPPLGEALGQPVVVDNRPGAAGSIGAGIVAKAPPDGYTLFLASSSFTSNAVLQAKQAFDPLRDFEPITNIASGPFLLVVKQALPVSTVQELIAYAKANPGKLNYASSGIGSTAHLSGEDLKQAAGIEMTHITYRGAGPALADVIAGQVDLMFASIVSALPQAKAGKVKVLGISSARRSVVLPQYPTIAESGGPGFQVVGYFGLMAPARTPAAIVNRVQSAVASVLKRKDMIERLAADGAEPDGGPPAELRALLEKDMAKMAEIVRAAGIKPQ